MGDAKPEDQIVAMVEHKDTMYVATTKAIYLIRYPYTHNEQIVIQYRLNPRTGVLEKA